MPDKCKVLDLDNNGIECEASKNDVFREAYEAITKENERYLEFYSVLSERVSEDYPLNTKEKYRCPSNTLDPKSRIIKTRNKTVLKSLSSRLYPQLLHKHLVPFSCLSSPLSFPRHPHFFNGIEP